MSAASPPSYEAVQSASARAVLPISEPELQIFVLDGKLVYDATTATRWYAQYELSFAPTVAKVESYTVSKVRYKLVNRDDEEYSTPHTDDHIYDFRMWRHRIEILPASKRKQYWAVMLPVWKPPADVTVGWDIKVGNFRTDQGFSDRFRHTADIRWLRSDQVVALEKRASREKESGKLLELPKLCLQVKDLDEKDLDFLVTIWVARVWRESVKEREHREDPMSLDKLKRMMEVTKEGDTTAAKSF